MSVVELIPVIDLKGGQVVRAQFGRRDDYWPIQSPLSATSDPIDVARGLLSLYPFETFYIADLDAIEPPFAARVKITSAACIEWKIRDAEFSGGM